MSDESTLRQKARQALLAGKLPGRPPERMWGGRGAGACCVICGEPVKHGDAELELEFDREDGAPDPSSYHVHVGCFSAWQSERRRLDEAGRTILPGAGDDGTIPGRGVDTTQGRGPA